MIHSSVHPSWLPRPVKEAIGGLKLDDEAVRVAVGLRPGLNLCVPRQCKCGAQVDARVLGKASRHHALNDVVARAFSSAGVPVVQEPADL